MAKDACFHPGCRLWISMEPGGGGGLEAWQGPWDSLEKGGEQPGRRAWLGSVGSPRLGEAPHPAPWRCLLSGPLGVKGVEKGEGGPERPSWPRLHRAFHNLRRVENPPQIHTKLGRLNAGLGKVGMKKQSGSARVSAEGGGRAPHCLQRPRPAGFKARGGPLVGGG